MGGDWVGATFGDPRTPEKAQRRLGGLPIKKKKKKEKKKKNQYLGFQRISRKSVTVKFLTYYVTRPHIELKLAIFKTCESIMLILAWLIQYRCQ